jgi:hypothetical protein
MDYTLILTRHVDKDIKSGGLLMKIARPALVLCLLTFCFLILASDPVNGQVAPPHSYLFVEVKDTGGQVVPDATVKVSDADGEKLLRDHTDKDGSVKANFWRGSDDQYYELQVSKVGYLRYEQVFFFYPGPYQHQFTGRVEEVSNSETDLKNSESIPVKIILSRIPTTTAEYDAAEVEEQNHQLLLAVKRGDAMNVRKLLKAGLSADTTDARGVPAIVWAALAGKAETINLLLTAGADVRNKDRLGHQALLVYLSEGISRERATKRRVLVRDRSIGPEDTWGEQEQQTVKRFVEAGAGLTVRNSYRGTD